ncbi:MULTISPECIES: DUF1905 domain-containing protein [unclassified Novosphingobium]|uniref:DUF1905 domain-containing protein n=1 Tax=unclassified Novosphingobium TaxID=2644732 RepID=UPI001469B0F2|nr:MULTISPECIES: DUF1905 domain-containing protein [unclassified Novosphingobium]NMN06966.1 hypothetical protein [Novosphingobium sp. SG919]NMN89447.1 hypothetical protein [Novosphingobium sp. SG916]
MRRSSPPLAEITFTGEVIAWRGPAPYVFVALPDETVMPVRVAAREASYGWGVVPVAVWVRDVAFTTSLFPREGGYLLPLKVAVRKATGIDLGDRIAVRLAVVAKNDRA